MIESRFGKLALAVSLTGDAIEIERAFALTTHQIAISDYADFCTFAREVDEALKARITLAKKP